MNNHEIIKKLIGPIGPIGESNADKQRFENLKDTIVLIEELLCDVERIVSDNKHAYEHSVVNSRDYAANFLKNINYDENRWKL